MKIPPKKRIPEEKSLFRTMPRRGPHNSAHGRRTFSFCPFELCNSDDEHIVLLFFWEEATKEEVSSSHKWRCFPLQCLEWNSFLNQTTICSFVLSKILFVLTKQVFCQKIYDIICQIFLSLTYELLLKIAKLMNLYCTVHTLDYSAENWTHMTCSIQFVHINR